MPDTERSSEAPELETLLNSKEPAAALDAILGNTPSGAIIACTPDGKILRFSNFAAQLLGWERSAVEGRTLAESRAMQPAHDAAGRTVADDERPLMRALRSGETVTGFELWLGTPSGELIPCLVNAAPIRNSRGVLIGAISSFADLRPYKTLERSLRDALRQREEALAQREGLYRELTHRVKNHLQIMTALVDMDARNPALSTQQLGNELKGRLQTLAAVYRSLDDAGVGERVEARPLLENVARPYASGAASVEVAVTPTDLTIAAEQASPLSMLVNEAVCNSCKHAFGNHRGLVQVSLRRLENGHLRLEIADDGKGWSPIDPGHRSHGLTLMRMFAKQLHGELELSDRPHGGALVAAELREAAA